MRCSGSVRVCSLRPALGLVEATREIGLAGAQPLDLAGDHRQVAPHLGLVEPLAGDLEAGACDGVGIDAVGRALGGHGPRCYEAIGTNWGQWGKGLGTASAAASVGGGLGSQSELVGVAAEVGERGESGVEILDGERP